MMCSCGEGGKLTDGMGQEVDVYCYARVALYKALGQDVEQHAEGMVHRSETLQVGIV